MALSSSLRRTPATRYGFLKDNQRYLSGRHLALPDIFIALATYNGARYLPQQIDSIRAQTLDHWTLLLRDDGSTDGTADILLAQATADPRTTILPDSGQRLGCVPNFSRLASAAFERGAPYLMLADQDDIWFPTKIERTLACMTGLEQRLGKAHPILVHSDLEVADRRGRRVAPSFMRFQAIRHETDEPLRMLLVQNFVTGCTVMANRALLSLALPIPPEALMHDWWFGLCAAACGSHIVRSAPSEFESIRAGLSAAPTHAAVKCRVAELIVGGALLRVFQRFVGFVDFLELALGILVAGIAVWVEVLRQTAIGRFQILLASVAGDTQNFIIIALGHMWRSLEAAQWAVSKPSSSLSATAPALSAAPRSNATAEARRGRTIAN